MFLNKIDVPYCLVVFFVVCPYAKMTAILSRVLTVEKPTSIYCPERLTTFRF